MIILSLMERDPAAMRRAILSAPQKADAIEVRLDALAPLDRTALPALFEGAPRPIIATCRRRGDGGRYAGSERARRELLLEAVKAGASYIDVEHGTSAASLTVLASETQGLGIIISHHDRSGMPARPAALYRRLCRIRGVKAVKIVGTARRPADLMKAHDLLAAARGSTPLISFCMGETGTLTRLLALEWGSWATYASDGAGRPSAPGQVSLTDLVEVYRIEEIDSDTRLAGIIGTPLGHSLSPVVHNAAYRASGLNFRYVPIEIPSAACLKEVRPLMRALRIRGLSVTSPYKTRILRHLDLIEPLARKIGAVNTIVSDGRKLCGFNTDASGGFTALADALEEIGLAPGGLTMAVIGSGGSARALAHAAAASGARVLVASRSERPGRALARAVRGRYVPLRRLARESYEVLINCTPVGMKGSGRPALPVPESAVKGRLAFDVIYAPESTPLLLKAGERGLATLGGLEMLVRQAAEQHALFTGRTAPLDVMRDAARQSLPAG